MEDLVTSSATALRTEVAMAVPAGGAHPDHLRTREVEMETETGLERDTEDTLLASQEALLETTEERDLIQEATHLAILSAEPMELLQRVETTSLKFKTQFNLTLYA